MLAIVVLAAGKSSRMGGSDKLLEVVNGAPLLKEMASRACGSGMPTYVCVAPNSDERRLALSGLPVTIVVVDDADLGMAHSLRAGIQALPDHISAAAIMPADMPELTILDLIELKNAHQNWPNAILRGASSEGVPGHPVIFPKNLFRELTTLNGDSGARSIVKKFQNRVQLVPLPNSHALVDLDTQQEWRDWRQSKL